MHDLYTHIRLDVRGDLPEIDGVEILINNAGTQNEDDIDTFCTGKSIVIDGGESINSHFVWPSQ